MYVGNVLVRTLNLEGTLVVKALVSQTQSEKHQLASKSLQSCNHTLLYAFVTSSQSKFIQFCAASQSSDIQTFFSSTLMLKAEVLWILNTVA